MTIDVGTGNGRAVLAAATRDRRVLAIGLDAHASSMAEASRRAARNARKGGLGNALFVVAAAEAVPKDLGGVARSVTVTLPWGSLLRGCLGAEPAVTLGVRSLLAADGTLTLLLAPSDRDRLPGLPTAPAAVVAAARAAFEATGLAFVEGRMASPAELSASGSAWARRLMRDGRDRRAALIRFASP